MGKLYFIPYNTPSSKNNKQWTGKFLVWSKLAQKYRKDTKQYWIEHERLLTNPTKLLEKKKKNLKINNYEKYLFKRLYEYLK